MSTPGGYIGGGAYLISPAYAVTPFVTVAGVLIGNDLVSILPASIYPRKLLGINLTGPSSSTEFDVYLGSPSNLIDSTNVVSSNRLQYNTPFDVPPGTQVFCYWRNAASITPVAATVAVDGFGMAQSLTTTVNTAAGTAVGDTLYAFHYDAFCNTNPETTNMTAPTGTLGAGSWTPMANSNNGGGACGCRLWKATTVASGAHSVISHQTDGSSSNGLIVVRARGVSFDAAAAGQAKLAGSVGAAVICPDISGGVSQQAQDTLFRMGSLNNGTAAPTPSFTTPSGYSLDANQTRAINDEQTLYHQVMAAGATSIGALTLVNAQTQADAWASLSLLIRGSGGASSQAGNVTFQMSAG